MPATRADFLLIDNSNSFTKFALASRKELIGAPRRLSTRELTHDAMTRVLHSWEFGAIVLSSVVPEKGDLIADFFAPRPVLRVTAKTKLGVAIDYPQPGTIGADRLANAAAANAIYGAPVVVVDFGTAVSFDIVASSGYVGGVIAPGLEAMTDYLHQRTALLPKISLLEPPSAIGKSTKHAMLAGAVHGYRGLVREILEQIKQEMKLGKKKLRVVATGGYADLIAAKLPEINEVQPELTLDGLRIIGTLNIK
jgi:type III pantothenate kinase